MKALNLALAGILALGSASHAFAEEEIKVAERFSGTSVTSDVGGEYTGMGLTVTRPDDYWIEATSEKGAPAVDLREGGTLSDSVYTYQLSGATAVPKRSSASIGIMVATGAPRRCCLPGPEAASLSRRAASSGSILPKRKAGDHDRGIADQT